MLRPSKKLVLALEAVTDIAYHGGVEPVQSQDIARRLNLPRRYLEQVMQQLVRAGILRGVRGPRGGYRLARERHRVSVGDVVRVVRGIEELPAHDMLASSSELGRRAKYYRLTASGRRQLTVEAREWERMSTAIGRVMKLA